MLLSMQVKMNRTKLLIGICMLLLLLVVVSGCSSFESCVDLCHMVNEHEMKCLDEIHPAICFKNYAIEDKKYCYEECK